MVEKMPEFAVLDGFFYSDEKAQGSTIFDTVYWLPITVRYGWEAPVTSTGGVGIKYTYN